jgi:cysteine desulfuration protein SufE
MSVSVALPARLAEIVDDFSQVDGLEKLELLLQYSLSLPPLPDWLKGRKDEMEAVPECMTPVSVMVEMKDGGMLFYFDVPHEAPTVRGFAAIVAEGLNGVSPQQILETPTDFYLTMGLEKVLTPQRMNGMAAIVAHVRRLAFAQMSK